MCVNAVAQRQLRAGQGRPPCWLSLARQASRPKGRGVWHPLSNTLPAKWEDLVVLLFKS